MEFFEDNTIYVETYMTNESTIGGYKKYWHKGIGDGTYFISESLRLKLKYEVENTNISDVLNIKLYRNRLVLYNSTNNYTAEMERVPKF